MHWIRTLVPGIGLMIACLACGCSLTPVYERPISNLPAQWSDGTHHQQRGEVGAELPTQVDWRSFVVDDQLSHVIAIALQTNLDLRRSVLNVAAARAEYRIQDAEQMPSLQAEAVGSRQRSLDMPGVQSSYQVGVGLPAFELDLFGRARSLSDAALHAYLATDEARESARISLIADVIEAYLRRDGAQRRYAMGNQILDARQLSLELIQARRDRGLANMLEYQEAAGLVYQAEVELEQIDRQFRQATNALGLLIGTPVSPRDLPEMPGTGAAMLADIAAGVPSSLLASRPDIRAAEHRLIGMNANIGAARAAFFPRITLTGSIGAASPELSELLGSGKRVWSFAPTLTLPIFDGGANRANLALARVRNDVAVAEYERAVQVAFMEVSDALATIDTLGRELHAQQAAAQSSAEARRLAGLRYARGFDDHLRFLDAQRVDAASQMALIEVEVQRQLALAGLFRSLGGSWLHG
ncbi:multidrug efflux system outer membrane protein [Xanthomonas arboricola]